MTLAPVNPIIALGSARMTSPKAAKLAMLPPMVGSARTEMKGRWRSAKPWRAATVLAICIREKTPSCIRAPPEEVTQTNGILASALASMARASRSPTAVERLPPRNPKSKAARPTGIAPIWAAPLRIASGKCWRILASSNRST